MNAYSSQFPPEDPRDPEHDTVPLRTTQPYAPDPNQPPYNPPAYPPQAPGQPPYQPQGPYYPQQPYPQQPYQQPPYQPPGQDPYYYPPQQPGYGQPARPVKKPRRPMGCCGCASMVILFGALLVLAYFLAPLRTNFLVLGIDRTPEGTAMGRSDTMILVSVVPLLPNVEMLSIPRDLWVNIPGVGENRINTAHFFAEANEAGSGPAAAAETVSVNFNVDVPYYVRVRFDTVTYVVNAMGGVTVNLPREMAGLPQGEQVLNGEQALAFARDRKGADDFFRMENAQILVKAIAKQLLLPTSWNRIPDVINAAAQSVDTNMPLWQMPRVGVAVLRAVLTDSIDNRTIQREMVQPFVTDGGAQVLLPQWDKIDPLMNEMFR